MKLIFPFVVLGILANPRITQAAEKWLSVRSQNFQLVGNGSEGQIRRVARNLEQFRAAFAILFPGAGQEASTGTTVVVFKDDNSFKPFKPLYEGKPANIAGYFQAGSDVNFIALNGEIQTPRVIYHEFVHSLTRETTHRLPAWASEGLAEFYSTFDVSTNGKTVDLGRPIGEHVVLLREKHFIPLNTFLGVDQKSPYYNEQSKQGIFYAQSWALVHYLMNGSEGKRRPQFTKYLGLLASGKSIADSFHDAFETDYAGIEKELTNYIQHSLAWPYFKVTLPEKLDVDRDTITTPLSEAHSDYFLGDLMLHSERYDLADKQLQKAISLDPKFAGSYASMGMLRLRQDQREEALKFLSKAVEADSQNHMAHYYYASLLQKFAADEGDDDRRKRLQLMRTHLRKSIEIQPRFVEPYGWLGYIAQALHEELNETETALGKAIGFSPGREDLRVSLAEVMVANKKEAAAQALLTPLRNVTIDPVIRDRATNLLDYIARRLESDEAMREYERRRKAAEVNEVAPTEKPSNEESPPLTRDTSTPAPAEPGVTTNYKAPPDRRVRGPEVEGTLVLIDCVRGMTLHLRVGNGIVKLHTDTPAKIDFVSYMTGVKDSIGCGPVKPELHVVVVYRRSSDPAFLGEPLVVEFRQ